MKQAFLLLTVLIVFKLSLVGQQERVLITETTVKVSAMTTQDYYFGFDSGDHVFFNFELLKGKDIKEIEIFEYPNASLFMAFKTKSIKEKEINIIKKGIYKFSFKNTAVGIRVGTMKVERIPASSNNKIFNPTVYWRTLSDTSYYFEDEPYIISKDTAFITVVNPTIKVHSSSNFNGNTTTYAFNLPNNTVAWSYYLGVDQSGQEAYEKAAKELAEKAAPIVSKFPAYGPLAALALGSTSYITRLQQGEDIDFYIVEGDNVNLVYSGQEFYYLKKGKVINDFARMKAPLKGILHFCFSNDNAVTGVLVTVKVVAVTVKVNWGTRQVKRFKVNTWQEPYLKD